MVVETNWGNFSAKFSGREERAFEWLCSLLFYKEHRRPAGSLRYFNQAGVEAEPITVDNEVIGFQAKFISTSIAAYKSKLIAAIDTAKTKNPTLTKLHFYVNLEFGESKKAGVKDPPYKTDIEKHAQIKGLTIIWKTASFFESPFVCETNANIAQHFFSLGKSVHDFVGEMERHTEALLDPIRSSITADGRSIRIDRTDVVARLKDTLSKSSLVIVSGEGGVGKTAVIKDLFHELKSSAPFFVFKASEFNVPHINQLFKEYGPFTFSDFVREHEEFPDKYVVVDSAEKLSDLSQPEVFQEFLSTLRAGGWKTLFTTRLSYLEDLKYVFVELYRAPFEPINIPSLTEQQLRDLSVAQHFSLPMSERLRRLLQNPFYLNEYLRIAPAGSGDTSYADFREMIWNRQIARSSYQKDNAHRKREACFLKIAHQRALSGRFFVTVEGFDEALRQLESDEIIKFDSKARGYFITHDIYEEWALERILEQSFASASARATFYQAIGDALAIRRAFRGWLSETLADRDSDAARLIEDTLNDAAIARHWKDESIVAALLSPYSAIFIQHFEQKLLDTSTTKAEQNEAAAANDQNLLYRTLFLLRIACKEVDQNLLSVLESLEGKRFRLSSFVTRPKGSGWQNIIAFLNCHKEAIGLRYLDITLSVLEDWIRYNNQGDTARAVGQIALYYLEELTKDGEFPYHHRSEVGEQLIRVILSASGEVKAQLGDIFRGVVARREIEHGSRYHELVTTALASIDKSAIVAAYLPRELIALAGLLWPYTPAPDTGHWRSDYRNDMEQYFDLAPDHFEHHPSSAFHTPILGLLRAAPRETADFILAFTNRSIEYFAKTTLGGQEIEEVEIFVDTAVAPHRQYVSDRLWNIYRGTTVAPALLQSMHMALERWLLMQAKAASASSIESWCLYLIRHSKSASITALIASVVLAEPSKLFNVAKVLFRTKRFFLFDLARMQHDLSARSLYGIGRDPTGTFQNERLNTCDDKHRASSLEHLALKYQLFRTEGEDEAQAERQQKAVWLILDEHYARLPGATRETDADKTWRLCLARMDRRKMNISAEPKDDKMMLTFSPQIDPELKEYSETALARTQANMRYTPFYLWARQRWEGNSSEYSKYPQYEGDISNVLRETADVWEALHTASDQHEHFGLFYRSVPPTSCAVLLRDFGDKLGVADLELCREVLLAYASLPFRGRYDYQIGDGLDAAIRALPLLSRAMPECRVDALQLLLFTLFDRHPVGMEQRFSDHAVAAILDLWETNPADANSLFLGYLHLQPEFKKVSEVMLIESRKQQIFSFDPAAVMHRFARENESAISGLFRNEVASENALPITRLDDDALVSALLLLPPGTQNDQHKAFIVEVASAIVKKSRRRRKGGGESIDFGTQHRFLRKFAQLALTADKTDIPNYLQPIVDNFNTIDYAEEIFQAFVSAEDALNRYEPFWVAWELFYPPILELCKKNRGMRSSVIRNYLLAWPYWREDAKQWHSLKEREKGFFSRVASDIGSHPAVLYSLAKLLNEIGSDFASDGIHWISGILERSTDLADEELEKNTTYYLENFVRGFVLRNPRKVRTTPQTKVAILTILNFLIEQGSVTAYLVRENVL
jgi:hypothetical protein